jgi:NitT/TauT family transport system substrate-binding protein
MRELLECCVAGDSEAIATLVHRFRAKAVDLAAALLGDDHLAEDAVQQAFLTALRKLPTLREPAAFAAWFRQIVRRECNGLRRRRREVLQSDPGKVPASAPSPSEEAQDRDRRRLIRQALASLPGINREAAEMYYLEERGCVEIGARLDLPVGTVKRRLHDARARLRRMLLGQVAEPHELSVGYGPPDWPQSSPDLGYGCRHERQPGQID